MFNLANQRGEGLLRATVGNPPYRTRAPRAVFDNVQLLVGDALRQPPECGGKHVLSDD